MKTIYACELDTKQPEPIEDRMSRKYGHEPFPELTPAQIQEYVNIQSLSEIGYLFYYKPHLRQSHATYQHYVDTIYNPAFEDLRRSHAYSGTYLVDEITPALIWVNGDYDAQEVGISFIRIWCTFRLLKKEYEQEVASVLMEWRGRNLSGKG